MAFPFLLVVVSAASVFPSLLPIIAIFGGEPEGIKWLTYWATRKEI